MSVNISGLDQVAEAVFSAVVVWSVAWVVVKTVEAFARRKDG